MAIVMDTRFTDLMENNNLTSDMEYGPYINFTGGAQRTLMVRIKEQLSIVVCSLYNEDHYQLGQISTLINAGALTKNNNY